MIKAALFLLLLPVAAFAGIVSEEVAAMKAQLQEDSWQVFAGVSAQISRWGALIVGYRATGYEYNQAGFAYDVTTYDPVVGLEFSF
jgi:hypothetical protein